MRSVDLEARVPVLEQAPRAEPGIAVKELLIPVAIILTIAEVAWVPRSLASAVCLGLIVT